MFFKPRPPRTAVSCPTSSVLAAAGLALGLISCSHNQAEAPPRFAVLRFENLTPQVSLDWMGRAASEIIAREIAGGQTVIGSAALHSSPFAQLRPISAPGESAERSAALAEGATRLVLGQVSLVRQHLVLDITERDVATGRTLQAFTMTSSRAGDLYGLADAVAHKLSSRTVAFDSKSDPAIAAWASGIEESDYPKAAADLERAAQTDPGFAAAWLSWAEILTAHGDRPSAEKVLAAAQQNAPHFSDVNRARVKLAAVELTGDRAATLAAINELGKLLPDDIENVRAVANQNYISRQFQTAAAAYRRLSQMTPNNPEVWNQLGYASLYAGDYEGAMSALQSYQRLVPTDVNPLDSQGDVAFAFGRFADAEKLYEQSAAKNRTFQNSIDLYKAAEARLMTGDVAGAGKKFDAYADARRTANDPELPFRAAQWRFLSGKHDEALAALARLAASPQAAPQLKGLALDEMAIWDLQLGRRDRALQESGDALKMGGASTSTLLVRFAAEDAHTAADWSARADRLLGSPQLARLKPIALAYALYLSRDWQAAEPLWKQLLDRSVPDDSVTPVIYAHILVELNRAREAEPLVRLFPVPHPDTPQEFLSLAIPNIFHLRAAVLASQGKTSEAEASQKIFKPLWGPS